MSIYPKYGSECKERYNTRMSDVAADTGVSETPAAPVAAPVESAPTAPVIETPAAASPPPAPVSEPAAAAPVTDKLPEQFSATPPHSQADPALRQGPDPVSPVPVEPLSAAPVPTPAPEIPTPQAPQTSTPTAPAITSYFSRALDAIQFRKRAKLDKILILAAKKKSIKNDDVEKLLRVSDSTASRYLAQLVKEGRLRRVGKSELATYEPV